MACAAVGRNQEARAWLRLAISHDPLDAESQQTLFELEHAAASRSAGFMKDKMKGRLGSSPASKGLAHPSSYQRIGSEFVKESDSGFQITNREFVNAFEIRLYISRNS